MNMPLGVVATLGAVVVVPGLGTVCTVCAIAAVLISASAQMPLRRSFFMAISYVCCATSVPAAPEPKKRCVAFLVPDLENEKVRLPAGEADFSRAPAVAGAGAGA